MSGLGVFTSHNNIYQDLRRSSVTSLQPLHGALAAGVRGPDLLAQLLDDRQQLCIFVLRHLASGGALRARQRRDEAGLKLFTSGFD